MTCAGNRAARKLAGGARPTNLAPGATMSGFTKPSRVGPAAENGARKSSEEMEGVPLSDIEPAVMT